MSGEPVGYSIVSHDAQDRGIPCPCQTCGAHPALQSFPWPTRCVIEKVVASRHSLGSRSLLLPCLQRCRTSVRLGTADL
eukprot:scaffold7387_cov408-Prasinococcus_capsulatus_cf.AAC.22